MPSAAATTMKKAIHLVAIHAMSRVSRGALQWKSDVCAEEEASNVGAEENGGATK
jgi:hypothetical protein